MKIKIRMKVTINKSLSSATEVILFLNVVLFILLEK